MQGGQCGGSPQFRCSGGTHDRDGPLIEAARAEYRGRGALGFLGGAAGGPLRRVTAARLLRTGAGDPGDTGVISVSIRRDGRRATTMAAARQLATLRARGIGGHRRLFLPAIERRPRAAPGQPGMPVADGNASGRNCGGKIIERNVRGSRSGTGSSRHLRGPMTTLVVYTPRARSPAARVGGSGSDCSNSSNTRTTLALRRRSAQR
ncbi:hypothetical protein HPB50_005067 [Hyalomma asiaticum]|uniref:Uncharacterized protein n=1 Tax=Hyalomma asiaticum TaxID=266040 RepID=A0ACB7SL54_HYAAI|nr:hypothetical protein HPB50_005067 [Hyalomma asiaticum]